MPEEAEQERQSTCLPHGCCRPIDYLAGAESDCPLPWFGNMVLPKIVVDRPTEEGAER